MQLLLIARTNYGAYKAGDLVARYDMTRVMDIEMGQHRIFIRLFDHTKIRPWTILEYHRSSIYLRFDGANTGTYNCKLWNNRNREGLS